MMTNGNPREDPARAVEEELRFHIEERVEQLEAEGVPTDEAKRRAREEFGDIEYTRAYCVREDRTALRRGWIAGLLRGALDDTRTVLRQLMRRPGAIVAPLVVLALAVALNSLVFTVVKAVLLAPPPVESPDRTYVLEEVQDGGGALRVSYPVVEAWREAAVTLERVGAYAESAFPLVTGGAAVHLDAAAVTPGFFDLFETPFARGTGFAEDDHHTTSAHVAVVSEGLWRRAFAAREDLVGSSVRLNGEAYRVTGIVRTGAALPENVDLWVPIEPVYPGMIGMAGARMLFVMGVLRDGVDPAQAQAELGRVAAAVDGGGPGARVTSLQRRLSGDFATPLVLLESAVLLVLLAACANAGGMLLTRAVRRRTELAVRASLGAGPARIVTAIAGEGLLLGLTAGVVGVLVARVALTPTLALVPPELPRLSGVRLDPGVVVLALALATATGVLAALGPAVAALRARPASLVRASSGQAGGGPWLRRVLDGFVVAQVALATMLTLGGGLLAYSFVATLREDPGFQPDQVTVVDLSLPGYRYPDQTARLAFARTLLARARSLPGVTAVAIGRNLPVSESNMASPLRVEGQEQPTDAVQIVSVSAGYFGLLGIPFIDGGPPDGWDREGGAPTLVVDRTLREHEPALHVGARARSMFGRSGSREVAGIVGPVRHGGLRAGPVPIAYEPFFQGSGANAFSLLVRSEAPPAVIAAAARDLVQEMDPEVPANRVGTMTGRLRKALAEPRFYTIGMGVFALLSVILALAGCQAGLAHRTAARRREFGLRMALGATGHDVRAQVVRRGVGVTLVGAGLGVLAAIPASRLIEGQLYHVSATNPAVYGVLVALLALGAAFAADVPARRAAAVDPVSTLRED